MLFKFVGLIQIALLGFLQPVGRVQRPSHAGAFLCTQVLQLFPRPSLILGTKIS